MPIPDIARRVGGAVSMLLLVVIFITRGPTRPRMLDDGKGFGEPAPAWADPEATVPFIGATPGRSFHGV